jgi:cell wall-associated NlpC family hydrolase
MFFGVVTRSLRPWARIAILVAVPAIITGCASAIRRPTTEAAGFAVPPTSSGRIVLVGGGDRAQDGVVRAATRYLGTPYQWGGASPSGFDCSGFVRHVYARIGTWLPRTVKEQYQVGAPVSRDRLRPGDIVFFDRLRHNGVYIGNDQLIHASPLGGKVRIASLDDEWFRRKWTGARRPDPGADASRLPVTDPD